MKKSALALGLVGVSLLVAACSGGADDPPPFAGSVGGLPLADVLASRTGARIFAVKDATGAPYGYVATDEGKAVVPANPTNDDLRGFVMGLGDAAGLGVGLASAPVAGQIHGRSGAASIRFGTVVPGTSVPVFDSSVVLGVRENGTFAYLETDSVEGLENFDVRPAIDAESAVRIALGHGSADSQVPEAPVLGVLVTAAGPVLVYRVEIADPESPLRAHVDAKSGAVISEGAADTHALAYSAASYYATTDPRSVPQATLECELSNGHLARATRGGKIELFDLRSRAPISGTAFGNVVVADVEAAPPAGFPASKVKAFAPGVAVDAQFNLGRAAQFFGTALATTFGRKDGRIPVYVHSWFSEKNAGFSPSWNAIVIGDGVRVSGASSSFAFYSPAVAYDMMAHEYAHGMLHNGGLSSPQAPAALPANATPQQADRHRSEVAQYIEGRAIHEGLADVFAASAVSALDPTRPIRSEVFTVGLDARPPGALPYRNHLHPESADADQRSTRNTIEMLPAGDIERQAYFRSGLVAHAFALMSYGGANDISGIGVDSPLGVSPAFYAFAIGSMFVRGKSPNVVDLAHATIATQIVPASRTAAACAWVAVGVLSESTAKSTYGATCGHFDASACSRLPDGIYCNAKSPATAYQCRNHATAGAPAPCATGNYCQRTSSSFASQAVVDARGALICGTSRDPL